MGPAGPVTMPGRMPLAAQNISFSYGEAPVLRGVSFALRPGEVTALVGPNGAGKSTLLRILLGVLRPDAGLAALGGTDVHALPAAARAARIAYVPQRTTLAFSFSVRQVVAFGRYAGGGGPDAAAIDRALAAVDLAGRADAPYGTLSAGQQQRATLARALVQIDRGAALEGKTLLADEPVAAMDPRHAIGAMVMFRDLALRGLSVLVVLHDLTLALRFAHRALVLGDDGALAADGPAHEALDPSILSGVFAVPFQRLGGEDLASAALIASAAPPDTMGTGPGLPSRPGGTR